jgi:hypothetical protein
LLTDFGAAKFRGTCRDEDEGESRALPEIESQSDAKRGSSTDLPLPFHSPSSFSLTILTCRSFLHFSSDPQWMLSLSKISRDSVIWWPVWFPYPIRRIAFSSSSTSSSWP